MKRIFTAINLPADIKQELVACQQKWDRLPVRWTPEDNLHITLVFIGSVSKSKLSSILAVVDSVSKKGGSFSLSLERIILGPPNGPPRMFWVMAERKPEIVELHRKLEQALVEKENTAYNQKESRKYLPHITLGRIQTSKWRNLPSQPRIDRRLHLSFNVGSVEVMESFLKPTGAEYRMVETFPL